MALTVTTPANSLLLCSVADVMDELGCSSDDDQSTLVKLCQQASEAITAYCGRQFAKQTYQESVAGYGDVHLLLSVYPIISVSQILCSGAAITDYTIQDPDGGMLYRESGWQWTTQWVGRISPKPWPQSEEAIFVVDYVAGYDLPDELLPTLPGDIERAAIVTVKDWFVNRKRNKRIKSIKAADITTQFNDESALPATAVRLLSTYRVTE